MKLNLFRIRLMVALFIHFNSNFNCVTSFLLLTSFAILLLLDKKAYWFLNLHLLENWHFKLEISLQLLLLLHLIVIDILP